MKQLIYMLTSAALVAFAGLALGGCGGGGGGAREPSPPAAAPTQAVVAPTQLPAPEPPAPSSSDTLAAPDFSLPSADGSAVSLAALMQGRAATVLVFYRGFF